MIRLLLVVAAVGALVTGAMRSARAEIGSYLLFDMADGSVIAAYRPTALWYPASLTKLMTAYVTFRAVEEGAVTMTSPVKISAQAHQQPPSRMGFAVGTVITVETALRIILTKSANDVSVALAEAVGGTQAGFVERMNAAAEALDMRNTRYDNPHGLPNRAQVTTARDVALLMRALERDFSGYADFFTMSGVRLGGKTLRNYNVLIRRFEGADGMKTGFICASGFNLAATATREGTRLGAVVLGGLTGRERNERTAELLEKGFRAVRTGGEVALDGFGDARARVAHAPVSGSRPPLGTVAGLPGPADEAVNDLRAAVCGATRPVTRYDDGVAESRESFEVQRAAHTAWQTRMAERESRRSALLATPVERPPPAAPAAYTVSAFAAPAAAIAEGPERVFAEPPLAPSGWDSSRPGAAPPRPPRRQAALPASAASSASPSDLAPSGWRSVWNGQPMANPLNAVPTLRQAPPERPPALPLGYLGPPRPIAPVAIALGGADPSRPEPLSGAIVGGGPAPLPRAKPREQPIPVPIDPEVVLRYADEVRRVAGGD